MTEKIVSTVYYNLLLLANLENEPEGGGCLTIDTYTFDPGLAKGDEIQVQDFKVGVVTNTDTSNKTFSFSATVMDIQKVAIRHQSFNVNIILESPEKETMAQIREALRARNSEQFPNK
ncbi:hypothetical protein [Anabaena azotica]|uniref:hypothetical protein n=1 Tax=Anabaena azotica TaxID=197653 RepID=UPI0039A51190